MNAFTKFVLPDGTVVQKRLTPSDVHVDRPLTNISVAYLQSETAFVADRIFPRVGVMKQSDLYYEYDRSYWYRSEMRARPPSTETPGGSMKVSTAPYYAEVYGVHMDIDDRVVANADDPLQPRMEATEWVTRQGLLFRELQWASKFFVTGAWTTEWTGVAAAPTGSQFLQWNDANSTPVQDVKAWKDLVHLQSGGFMPNVLVMGHAVYTALTEHPDIIDRIKYSSSNDRPAMVNRNTLAQLFELERIEVMSAIQNTGAEGGTETMAYIGGKNIGLFYVPARPGLRTPASGYSFVWNGYIGASNGQRVSSMRMDSIKSDRVEIEVAFDYKKVGDDLGFFGLTAVA